MSEFSYIPDGYHSVTPYLCFKDADAGIKFYEKAFGAKEVARLSMPGGGVAHAEIAVGNSRIMLSDEMPDWGNKSAESLGGSPIALAIYVADVDAAFERAVQAGAQVKRPVQDQFYGDRSGTIVDPFGYQWSLMTRKEEVSVEEMQRRMEQMFAAS